MTDYSKILALCIPTFNRPDFIKYQLESLSNILIKYNMSVYISDNSDNDDTAMVVDSYNDRLDLHYYKNERNIGDVNFLRAISYPVTDYRWIISDSTIFDENTLKKILTACELKKYDYVLLNSGRCDIRDDAEYTDYNSLLCDLGWHLTLLSSFVYSKEAVGYIPKIERYIGGNFLHHALMFEMLPYTGSKAYWIGSSQMSSVPLKKNNTWTNDTYKVWTKEWTNYIFSLPDKYSLDSKLKCIRDHGKKSHLFSNINICRQYANGVYSKSIYHMYKSYYDYALPRKKIISKIILFFPRSFFRPLLNIHRKKINKAL